MARYIAQFHPQAWINDHVVEVSAGYEPTWEVERLPPKLQEKADAVKGVPVLDTYDELKGDLNAPSWVREWDGPFSIFVTRIE